MARQGAIGAALAEAQRMLASVQGSDDRAIEAELLNQIAWFNLQLGHPETGRAAAVEAKRLWQEIGDLAGEAFASSTLSWLLVETGLVDEGFDEAAKALALAQRQDDRATLCFAQNAKAITYMYCRQDHLALPLLEDALRLAGDLEDPWLRALILVNIGYSLASLSEDADSRGDREGSTAWLEKAIDNNDQAIIVASECWDLWDLRTALCNGAEYRALAGQMTAAEDYLDHWAMLPGSVGLREEIHYLYTRGEILTKAGRIPEAIEMCFRAVDLAEQHEHADHKVNAYRRLAEALEAAGDLKGALEFQRRFHTAYHGQMGEVTRRRAQHVENELETVRLRTEATLLKALAERDPLTNLPNRRSFEARVSELGDTPFSLGILDLDHFKLVNDTYSHLVGDDVLKETAELLASVGDVSAFRLGGEEFALLFVDTAIADAAAGAERIRQAIERHEWSALAPRLAVSASVGLAGPGEAAMPELLGIADRRLYAAKKQGRNRVVCTG